MNTNEPNINDEILVKYLLGEATQEEQHNILQWLKKEENHTYFDHFKLIWDTSKKLAKNSSVDEEAAWQRFKQRKDTIAATQARPSTIPLTQKPWLRAAALILLLAGALTYIILEQQPVTIASHDQVLIQTLPDGSVITLNKNAALSYPKEFGRADRRVVLKGEAFFNITPNKKKPFIITANETNVKVVGTSFNVKITTEKTEVVVETGIVEVAKSRYAIRVQPNERATVFKDREQPLKQKNPDLLYNYYRTKEFVCNGTPLYKLVEVLNEAYNVEIVIENEQIKNLALTTTFKNESLNDILQVISATFNIKVEKSGKQILLK
jgi:ferric-dicitrate binding protein FerR (iron transport regulator)